ncbi:MAG: hypothetical protein Q9175_002208 [Cornicularia normoerica]
MSPDNTEEVPESASERVFRPPPPPPTASTAEARAFLIQFFLAISLDHTPEEALEMARKIKGDGKALYEVPLKKWTEEFGEVGQMIFRTLQTSKYGYDGGYWPWLKVVGALFFLAGLFNGAYQLWIERDARSYTVSIISTVIVAGLIIFNIFCQTLSIVDSTRFPEQLKLRASSIQPGLWGMWASN